MRLAAGLSLIWCAASAAADVTYEGPELEALTCADYFATAAVALEGELDDRTRAETFATAAFILENHVSGDWQQKDAAMRVIVSRRTEAEAIEGFRANRRSCLDRFPPGS